VPGCLYRLRFPNGKTYIGLSRHGLDWRWRRHLRQALDEGSQALVHRAIRQHGAASIRREVLLVADDLTYLGMMEVAAILRFGTLSPRGYNLVGGGEGTAQDLRAARRATWEAAGYRENQSAKQRQAWAGGERRIAQAERTRALWAGEYGERMRTRHAARPKAPPKALLTPDERAAALRQAWTPERRLRQSAIIKAVAATRRDALSAQAQAQMADPAARMKIAKSVSLLGDKRFRKARKPVRGHILRALWDRIPEVATWEQLYQLGLRKQLIPKAVANGNLQVIDDDEAGAGERGKAGG